MIADGSQCDGQRPCGRCKSQADVECVYEKPVRQSKENLRIEIDSLRLRQRPSEQVITALVGSELWEEVLKRLRTGESVESISELLDAGLSPGASNPVKLAGFSPSNASPLSAEPMGSMMGFNRGGNIGQTAQADVTQGSPWNFSSQSQSGSARSNSYPDVMNWTADLGGGGGGPPQSRIASWAEGTNDTPPKYRGLEQVLSHMNEPELKTPQRAWTAITNDNNLVQHLLALYFCWEYPTFASLSKEHFLSDFRDGRQRYCSPILVNALLALGCRFSTRPMTRENPNDPYTSGDHFFKESQRLFAQETDHHILTTIQALGIMSIREASCGRDSESWYYAGQSIRLAVEMGLHRIQDGLDEDELAVQAATFWGAFALDQ